MRSFKNGEHVLTRMLSPAIAVYDKGLRIIVRLYPIPSRLIDSNALCIKGLAAILTLSESRKEKCFSINGMCGVMNKYSLLSIGYIGVGLSKELKLLKVLTRKLLAREMFAGLKN